MRDDGVSAEEVAALRAAVLGWHERLVDPPSPRKERVGRRLHELHLTWLALPWVLVDLARMFWRFPPGRTQAAEERIVSRYRRLSGTDPHVARAEVWRIGMQLLTLDERDRGLDGDRPGAPRGADQAELEAATDALIRYYLAGRDTEDALLAEVEDAWAGYEALQERQRGRDRRERRRKGRRERRAEADADQRADVAAVDRYLAAWRRWFDRQTRPTETPPAETTPPLYEISVIVELDPSEVGPMADALERVVCPHDVAREPDHRCPHRWMILSRALDDEEAAGWRGTLNE